jgi:WD40 repeat protein
VKLWDVETGACQHTLIGHSAGIEKIVYSPNGNQIASASDDTTVRLWDIKTGMCSHIFIGHQYAVTRVVYSPRGDQVASAGRDDNTVRIWDLGSENVDMLCLATRRKFLTLGIHREATSFFLGVMLARRSCGMLRQEIVAGLSTLMVRQT